MPPRTKKERDELAAILNEKAAGPCILAFHRMGPTVYVGPFANFDAAGEYRRNNNNGGGQIIPLESPDQPIDWYRAGMLAG